MLGYPSRYRGGGSQINNAYVHSVGMYVNDIWRVSRRITVQLRPPLGALPGTEGSQRVRHRLRRENFDKGIRSVVYPNAPLGLVFKGDPGFPTNNANSNNDYNQWRRGLASCGIRTATAGRPSGPASASTTTSPTLWRTAHHMLNAPFGNTVDALVPTSCPGKPSRNGCPLDFVDPWNSTPGGDPLGRDFAHQGEAVRLPAANVAFPLNGGYVSMPVDAKPMRSYQYNLSYQRQLMDRLLVDVTYTGNQQRHIWIAGYAENPAVYIPGNCVAGQYALTAPGPCSNTSANNRQARAVLTLLNPTEGAYYDFNSGGNHTGVPRRRWTARAITTASSSASRSA